MTESSVLEQPVVFRDVVEIHDPGLISMKSAGLSKVTSTRTLCASSENLSRLRSRQKSVAALTSDAAKMSCNLAGNQQNATVPHNTMPKEQYVTEKSKGKR